MNLCIPRVKTTINSNYIKEKISNLKIGKIERYIEIPLKNDIEYKRILFKINLNNSEKAQKIKEELDKNGLINFVYEMPWYWKIFISNTKKNVKKNDNENNKIQESNNCNSLGLIG